MMDAISPAQLVGGLLIFFRVLGIFTAAPVFGHAHVPVQVKLGLALMITMVLFPLLRVPDASLAQNVFLLVGASVKEMVVGLIIGYLATLLFMVIQLAGEVVDIQIGFGMASLADPLLGTPTSLIGQFQYMLATLLFLALNGHHLLLAGLFKSFQLIPLGAMTMQPLLGQRVLDIMSQVFSLGLMIGAPMILAVLLSDLTLGLLGRTVPQMNLLMVGFPIKIFVGLSVLLASLPFFASNCRTLYSIMYRDIITILYALRPA